MKLLLILFFALLSCAAWAQATDSSETFVEVEEMPRFPGCEYMDGSPEEKKRCADQKLLEFIYKNIKYPRLAQLLDIDGMVVISFVVQSDGSITYATIVRDPDPTGSLGHEALRIVNAMQNMAEKWRPGVQRGKNVNVRFNLPVRFKLSGSGSPATVPDADYTAYHQYSFQAANKIYQEEELDKLPCLTSCKDIKDAKKRALCTQATIHNYLLKKIDVQYQKTKSPSVNFSFVIDETGHIGNFQVNGKLHVGQTELEIWLDLMKLDLEWQPALIDGKPVSTYYKGSFNFKKFKKKK